MLPRPEPLFAAGPLAARELLAADVPALQRFFDANPAYFESVHGEPAQADEAQLEFDDLPPPGLAFGRKWMLRIDDEGHAAGELVAMASLFEDFIAAGVWHLGLFIVASDRHGSGQARALYAALERWVAAQGGRWLRLGVVQGNERALRFWRGRGYVMLRERGPVEMGLRMNMLDAMLKPLAGGSVDEYLALVARDRPGAP